MAVWACRDLGLNLPRGRWWGDCHVRQFIYSVHAVSVYSIWVCNAGRGPYH